MYKWKNVLNKRLSLLFLCCMFFAFDVCALRNIKIKTKSKENRMVTVYYRVPRNYDKDAKWLYRVLVIFGGRNSSGRGEAAGMLGFDKWADKNDIFLVSPGFKNDEYWYPDKWSGRTLQKALKLIKKKYHICADRLLYYGWSGGSQCSNLFSAWSPQTTVAWVSHACGVWHKPTLRMQRVPGLVTCGTADTQRYILSRRFVETARKKGLIVLWKSFPNTPHAVPPKSVELAKAFLLHYHQLNLYDLKIPGTRPNLSQEKPKFVGDDLESRYWPVSSPMIRKISREDRVYLYTKELAQAWGNQAVDLYKDK